MRQPRALTRSFSSPADFSQSEKVRNIGIIAHIDAGKTTTTERMLYYAGHTSRLGDVDHGDTVTDFLPAERERGITIQSAAISFPWQNHTVNLIDTPGHADFSFEVVRSLRILDGAVTILDAVAGVEAQTEKVWAQAQALGIPRLVFVNKMDRAGAGFGRTVREVVSKLRTPVALLNVPYFEDDQFKGVLDVLNNKVLVWTGDGKSVDVRTPEEAGIAEVAADARAALVDALSLDEEVVNAYLEDENVSSDVLKQACRRLTLANEIVPVLCGASFRNIGVQPLLDAVIDYLPGPQVEETKGPATALAFKVRHDPIRGVLVYVRVYSGTLKKGFSVLNTTTGTKERPSKLLQMQADQPIEIQEIPAGSIGVLVGTKEVRTGDTLVAHQKKRDGIAALTPEAKKTKLMPITAPEPVFVSRVTPASVADTRGMNAALDVLLREDPSLRLSYDDEAGQWLLAGMGELHLEIAKDRLCQDLKANVEVGDIMITYKETLTSSTSAEASETDDQGAVRALVEIGPADEAATAGRQWQPLLDQNWIAVSARHPVVPYDEIQRACEVGVVPVLASGGKLGRRALQGLQFKVRIDMSPETPSAALVAPAVRQAAAAAIAALPESAFSLLEPVMAVTAAVPESDVGSVMTDLSANRRAHIEGMGDSTGSTDEKFTKMAQDIYTPVDHTMYMSRHGETAARPTTLHAVVPLRMLVGYLTTLRSMTQGRGTFQMAFREYQPVETRDVAAVLES